MHPRPLEGRARPMRFLTYDVVQGGRFLCGAACYDVSSDLITVRDVEGRRVSTQLGGMPAQVLARTLLRELDRTRSVAR